VPATGGASEVWVKLEAGERADGPQILNGGKAVLFSLTKGAGRTGWDQAEIVVLVRESGERKVVLSGGSAARYVSTGHIIYALADDVLAVPFDLETLEKKGGPVPIVEGVMRAAGAGTAAANFAVSNDGTLTFIPSNNQVATPQRVLALVDRTGKRELLGVPPGSYEYPRLSPDGKQVAVETADERSTIWIYPLSGTGALRRFTFEGLNRGPTWSPNSRRIAYASSRGGKLGIFVQSADGSGTPEELPNLPPGTAYRPRSWSPDGKTLAFSVSKTPADWGIWTVPVQGQGKADLFADVTPSLQENAAFSPDGRWIAYGSNESGNRFQIYVQPFPKTGAAKYQISREGGEAPLWSPDGKELFYYQTETRSLLAVPIQTQPTFTFGNPVPIPIERIVQGNTGRRYDITPDGMRFLVLLPADQSDESRQTLKINVVLNWFEELKQRVPAK